MPIVYFKHNPIQIPEKQSPYIYLQIYFYFFFQICINFSILYMIILEYLFWE